MLGIVYFFSRVDHIDTYFMPPTGFVIARSC